MPKVAVAEWFGELAARFDSIAAQQHAKWTHVAADVDQNTLRAWRVLEAALATHPLRELELVRKFLDPDADAAWRVECSRENGRLLWLWTIAVGSCLCKAHPEAFRGDADELDLEHVRVRPGTEYVKQVKRDKHGKIVELHMNLPDDALTSVEEGYDNDDAIARHRMRAANYADACRLLARLTQPRKRKSRSKRAARPATGSLTRRQQEAWLAYESRKTYTAVGQELGISRSAATKLVKRAKEKLDAPARSVSARTRLPTDKREQETI